MENILENLQSAVLIQSEDGNIVYANSLFHKMFHNHLQNKEIVGKSTRERAELIKHFFKEPDKFVSRVEEILEKKTEVKNEFLYLTDGRVIERDFIPYAVTENDCKSHLWIFRDITERKKLETELIKTKNELENRVLERTKEYESANAYLKEEIHFRKQSENKLQSIRSLLESIINNLDKEVFWSISYGNHDLNFFSNGIKEIYGVTGESFLKNPELWKELTHPDDKYLIDEVYKNIEKRKPSEIEARVVRPDGTIRWVCSKTTPVTDQKGDIIYLNGMTTDITERKLAEEKLINLTRQLKRAQQIANLGSWELDIKTNKFECSKQLYRIIGYEPDEIEINMDFVFKIIHPDYLEFLKSRAANNESVTESTYYELKIIRKDGEIRTLYSQNEVLFNSKGLPEKKIGVIYDITDVKKAEQRIIEQANLLDITQDAIIVKDLEGTILFWNKGAVNLYGWQAEEVLNKSLDNIVYKDKNMVKAINEEVINNNSWTGELKHVNKLGQDLIIESQRNLVTDENNNPKSILIVNTDITEKKKLEEQFLRAQRMESIGTLASGIAHDLNNILSPILIAVTLLRQDLPPEKKNHFLNIVESNINRGTEIIKQVLSFARGVKGEYKNIEPSDLINEIAGTLQGTFPKSIQIKTITPDHLCLVSGDRTQLFQVIMNLCVNARDAMPEGGLLTIKAENILIEDNSYHLGINATPGPYMKISVTDTGIGIPESITDKIFEPFFTTKGYGKGTGLGLSTAIGIIRSHKGFMSVNSEPEKGTEFSIYLPLSINVEIKDLPESKTSYIPVQDTTLLIVDDEILIVEVAKTILENNGYSILTACDGAEAVSIYAKNKNKIKAVLIDVMMPYMDGTETIRILENINPMVRIIASSGIHQNIELKHTYTSVKDFLSKPYTADKLLKAVYGVIKD